jgi:hypothetical protein
MSSGYNWSIDLEGDPYSDDGCPVRGKFQSYYNGHSEKARHFVLDKKLATVEELAFMSESDVDALITKHYAAFRELEDDKQETIYLVPRELLAQMFKIWR